MMKKHYLLFWLIPMTLMAFQFPNWESFLDFLQKRFENIETQKPYEKVYLQLDKPLYVPGDDIWFKAYITQADNYQATKQSDVLYVELINPKGETVEKLDLPISKGVCHGDFHISKNLVGGLYTVKAYTRWLKNFGEESYFKKTIFVQKIVKPNMLLKLDFQEKGYGKGDWVEAKLDVKDLSNQAIKNHEFEYIVQIEGKEFFKTKETTDNEGKALIKFQLPQDLKSPDALLNVIVSKNNRTESISRSVPITLNQISLQFFPEGGDMIANVSGKVAFKAVNVYGKPVDIEGVVLNEKKEIVQSFSSFHRGMGAFDLEAQDQEKYQVQITKPSGITNLYDLPKAKKTGMALKVLEQNEEKIKIGFHSPKAQKVYVIAQSGAKIQFSKAIKAQKGENSLNILSKDFPIGIARITLFDEGQTPQAERLLFLHPHKTMQVKISTNKNTYQPREKVKLSIKTTDENGKAIPANLSVSVVDERIIKAADDKQSNILAHLLLGSELRGKIDEPNFYFDKKEDKAVEALDYLMLTHGWRRFAWEEVLKKENAVAKFLPEKLGIISGRVFNARTNKPVENAKVTLLELDKNRRALQVKTNKDGSFVFLNTNPYILIQLIARYHKKKLKIILDSKHQVIKSAPYYYGYNYNQNRKVQNLRLFKNSNNSIQDEFNKTKTVASTRKTLSLKEETLGLSEVVVTGYTSTSESRSVSSVAVVDSYRTLNGVESFDQVLQGQAPGLIVQSGSGRPGSSANVTIRGVNSVNASNELLYIVDGIQVSSSDIPNSQDIKNATVIRDASATAMYGSRGANGVIVITTNKSKLVEKYNRDYYYDKSTEPFRKGYESKLLSPKIFQRVRAFASPDYSKSERRNNNDRQDFRTTIFWKADVQTDKKGEAEVSFYQSDDISTFQVLVEGISQNGKVGRSEYSYNSIKPFFLETKLPNYFCVGDTIKIPVRLENNTEETLTDVLKITLPEHLKVIGESEKIVSIPAKESKVVIFPCIAQKATAKSTDLFPENNQETIEIVWQGESYSDKVTLPIQVQPKGFPRAVYLSGQKQEETFNFEIQDIIPKSQKATLTIYTDILSDLMDGVEGIIRQPYGCFEQVSSSTYPNILALQYIKANGGGSKEIQERALKYIKQGYKKLAGYETRKRGFDWYGKVPPHLGMSAYGLLEFTDMQNVYSGVSRAMLKRTKEWILEQRDGKGNFKFNGWGYHGFRKKVMSAYVVYALSEAKVNGIDLEFETQYQKAIDSNDAYFMALMANAALNYHKYKEAETLLEKLEEAINANGFGKLKTNTSSAYRNYYPLQIETTALIGLALMKDKEINKRLLFEVIDYILSKRNGGRFGNTQGTVLSLKLLVAFAKYQNAEKQDGDIIVLHQGKIIAEKHYTKDQKGKLVFDLPNEIFKNGKHQIEVKFKNTNKPLPYTLATTWQTYTPQNEGFCPLILSTKLNQKQVKAQETVRMNIILSNTSNNDQPSSMAIVGIPSGLSLQPWQLKELQETEKVDFYEIHQNYVVFYYRGMQANETKKIALDLKADIGGSYKAPASVAYLYYQDEDKFWTKGTEIIVN